ncbi:MAG: NgoFVII family restriction endonuclease [Chloroflexi bacterium]|nr:NgoFVII family restriction endonuclease [Chloroflexota bacterium]
MQYANTRLQIVSGFATASMAQRHLETLKECSANASIELIVGMTHHSGIERAQHTAFCQLSQDQPYGMDFSCRYIAQESPIHAKCYVWSNDSGPYSAFCGSANYTMAGFVRSQIEGMANADPASVARFFLDCLPYTVDCLDESVLEHVSLTETRRTDDRATEDTVTLSLLISRGKRKGEIHQKSGLNWGFRPNRNRNEAYIPVPVQHYEFFPPIKQEFTVLTDDGYPFIFVKAQERGKALETPQSNAELGYYFRKRLGLQFGEFVTKQHLIDYGRTDVTFTKIDEETYLMDFSHDIETEHELEKGETSEEQ